MLSPYAFQQKIIDQIRDTDALFCDMGTGKTCMVLHAWKKRGRMPRTIVLAPAITLKNWGNEFKLWMDENVIVVDGTTARKRCEQILVALRTPLPIIINYEALQTKAILDLLIEYNANCVICDESHRIKNRTSKRFKAVQKVAAKAKYRWILSGTPIANSLQDIWAQYMFMDRGKTFGDNFFAFRGRYFVNLNAAWSGPKSFPKWVQNDAFDDEIKQKLAATSHSVRKEDCLELPDLVTQTLEVELSKPQRRLYDELARELIAWLEGQPDTPLVVQNALTKLLRLNQIATGFAQIGDKLHRLDNPRLDRLIELIEDIGGKVIVYCVFKQNYADICAALDKKKISWVRLTGAESMKQKHLNVEEFCEGEAQVCIANPRSAGLGINLKQAAYAIYYSRTHSMIDFAQSKDRNYRAGSIDHHKKITHYHMIAPDTIDMDIFDCILDKKIFADNLLDLKAALSHR